MSRDSGVSAWRAHSPLLSGECFGWGGLFFVASRAALFGYQTMTADDQGAVGAGYPSVLFSGEKK